MNSKKLAQVVDDYGRIKAEIAKLTAVRDRLRDKLIEAGLQEIPGVLFQAKVSEEEYKEVDYKGLLVKLKPSRQLLQSYTKVKTRVRVIVNAYAQ